jgi:hypothetical protein
VAGGLLIVRAPFVIAIACATACTVLETKDGLVGPPPGGDAGAPGSGPPDASKQSPLDAGADDGGGSSSGGSSSSGGGSISTVDGSAQEDASTGPEAIYTGVAAPLGIAVHAGTICWVEGESFRSITCGTTVGGPSQVVATQSKDALVEQAFDVALDDNNLYWSNGPKNQVVRAARDGSSSAQYFTGDQQVSYIVLEGTTVWITDYVAGAASGNVSYGPFSGSQSQLVYPGETQAAGVASYGGSVYWATSASIAIGPEAGNATIARVNAAAKVTGLAIDATGTTYFLAGNRDVYRLALGTTTPVLVYSPQGSDFGDSDLAVDDDAVYWSEHTTGRIMRLPKTK